LRRSFSWVDPTGVVWDLGTPGLGYFAMSGAKGLGALPVTFTANERERGGEDIQKIQPTTRFVTLPLCIRGADEVEFEARRDALGAAILSTRWAGPGQLRVHRADGTTRQIGAYYADGWDSDADLGITSDVMALTLRCPKPWFEDVDATTISRVYDSGGQRNFFSPYPAVSSGSTLGATTITNASGVEVWPSWTVTGPASSIIATSNTTGESWTLNPSAPSIGHGDLVTGETVTVITDPCTVRGPSGENWTGALNWPTAVLWRLLPGPNEITYAVTGSSISTSISLTYYRRHETA
jgi:hypothetical protein